MQNNLNKILANWIQQLIKKLYNMSKCDFSPERKWFNIWKNEAM